MQSRASRGHADSLSKVAVSLAVLSVRSISAAHSIKRMWFYRSLWLYTIREYCYINVSYKNNNY